MFLKFHFIFLAIEDNAPVTYHYGLLQLRRESSLDQKNAIIQAFQKDGLLEVMKQRVVALVTDGAYVSLIRNYKL